MKILQIGLMLLAIVVAAGLALRNAPMNPPVVEPPVLSPFDPTGSGGGAASFPAVLPFDPITRLELIGHVRRLADDEMEGRRTGEPGAERAAALIEEEFRRIGLRPGGDDGDYRQTFTAQVGARMGDDNRLRLHALGLAAPASGPARFDPLPSRADPLLGADWRPLSFSTRGHLRAPVTFCGYGITSSDPPYDDYEGQDVRGRVALVLRFEPGADDSLSPFGGAALTLHADLRNKAKNAFDHGAAGMLVLTGPVTQEDELLPFDAGAAAGSGHLPAAQIRRAALVPLLDALGVDLRSIQAEIDRTIAPRSLPLDLTVEMEVDVEAVEAEAFNLIGLLRGRGPGHGQPEAHAGGGGPWPRAEAIVIGAHYDHLGWGGRGSLAPDSAAIHNGADDNASGVAALIEIAEAMATTSAPIRRSIVFIAFTGEELGLLGSSYYAEHPLIPLSATRAMVNLDMIGRGREREVMIGGAGTSPELRRIAEEEARADFVAPVFSEGGYGPSDHTSFYSRDVPVLFFSSAPHEDYHRPTDDWEKLNYPYLERTARLVQRVVARLASDAPEIQFTRADQGGPPATRPGGEGYGTRGYGPYLGTIPDFGPASEGVKLSGVREGSPAAAAGLRRGDIVVGWNHLKIMNLEDYAAALRAHRPGDRIEIAFLREGERQTAVAVLVERR